MLLEERVGQAITEAEAVQFARELWGLETTATKLPGEYDDNFHLIPVASGTQTISLTAEGSETSATPGAFVLKVMHPAREQSLIDLQCRALQHLAERAPHLTLQRVCPLKSGELFTTVSGTDGIARLAWLLTFVPGAMLAEARPHSRELLAHLGQFLGEMDAALGDFSHPVAQRDLKWDLAEASWIRGHLKEIHDDSRRALVEKFLALYDKDVVPAATRLRRSAIYGDANDYNVLVSEAQPLPRKIASVIDFGDMHHSFTAAEAAIGAAYAMLGKQEPLAAATAVIAGYHGAFPLEEKELEVMWALIGARLAVSVVNSAMRATVKPDDAYVTISEAPAWATLERMAEIHPRFAHYTFREACGFPAVPESGTMLRWIAANAGGAPSLLDVGVRTHPSIVVDLSVGSPFLGGDPQEVDMSVLTERIFGEMRKARVSVGVGRYDEARLLYTSPIFAADHHRRGRPFAGAQGSPVEERRTIHLGIDLFVGPGTAVYAPFEGIVRKLANNTAALDYGPLVILQHETGEGREFFTLFGHLAKGTLNQLREGQRVKRGEKFARIGAMHENGGWPPHLHFQIILDLLEMDGDFPGVARASERGVWASLSPDPNLLLRIPTDRLPSKEPDAAESLAARKALLGPSLSISYQRPLKIVRGWMQYLYDESGRAYLDVYNNVPLVGHSHPQVVQAVQDQIAVLNTNTRYLHDNVIRYAARLTRLLPEPLRVAYFVNSGSEANELALRLARAHTRHEDIIVLEHAYHGNTTTLIDVSPYKFRGPGGGGQKPWVHVAPIPDDYRGAYRRDDPEAGTKYAAQVAGILEHMQGQGRQAGAFLTESLPSVAGQIVFPPGYLADVYPQVRAAGGVCIADEVQTGFGRLGTHLWGFETQGVVPDIVVMGKPIGNAFPLAAVITTAEIAASFANGMEYFSTFGGNPVASAAGLAVLNVLEKDWLQERALRVGKYWAAELQKLQQRHPLIGDVRGSGLYLGIDLVRQADSREPASAEAHYVVNRLRELGILAGTDGPHHNVIKLRPPLIFTKNDADLFVQTLDAILQEDAARPRVETQHARAATFR